MAGFEDVASPVQTEGFEAVATPTADKLPDTTGIANTAKTNLSANDNNSEGTSAIDPSTQTPQDRLNTAAGMPVTEQLRGSNAPLTPEMRGHLVDSYKAGTSANASEFMQTAVPALAHSSTAGAFARGAEQSALPTATGFAAFGPGAAAGAEMVAPAAMALAEFPPAAALVEGAGALIGGTIAALGTSYATAEGQKKFLEKHPQIAEKLGISNDQLMADMKEHPTASFTGQLAPNLAFMRPGNINLKPVALGAGMGAGLETGRELASDEKMDPEKIAVSTIMTAISNKQTMLGELISSKVHSGMEALKPIVGKILGKEPEAITHDDINQTISTGYKDAAPAASDFHTVADAMGSKVDALHETYKQTGVSPEQIFKDAQVYPEIRDAISEGRVPEAYNHLLPKPEEKPVLEGIPEEPTQTSQEYAKALYDNLHNKLGSDKATDIVSMKRELESKEAIGRELDEKLYLKKEDSGLQLSDKEQEMYDKYVKPLAAEERALYEKARELGFKDKEDSIGIEPESEDYVHRIVKGKGHYLDRYDTEFGGDENVGFGRKAGLSQTTASLKEAQFYALQDSEGNRVLKKGQIPEGQKAGDIIKGEDGKEYKIKRARTSEIEGNSELKYYKSAIGNTEDNIRRLEKTIRNIEFLNSLKNDVQKSGLGVPPNESFHPNEYQQVNIPQLRGWSFDARVAEVLNDIYDRGGDGLLARVNNFLIKGMFLNPVPHVENVLYDYISSRGWKNVTPDIKGANYINQGIKDVATFSPEYIEALKHGAAARLPAVWKTEFYNKLQRQFLSEMRDTQEGLELAKSWGFDTPASLAESVFNNSQKALWGAGDAFLMAKIRELKDGGMSTDQAIKEAQKHIVDYRIPPRVGENVLGPTLSRLLAQSLQGNPIVVFTRYHFGLFKSLGSMVKDLATVSDPKLAAKAAGQLFATYFLLSVVNPAIASVAGAITGKEMKMRNPGVTGLAGAITDVLTGKKSIGDALKTQFIVSPGIQVGADVLQNKIVNPDLGHKGVQLMDYLMKQPSMSIPAIPYNIREGRESSGSEALRQVGITEKKKYKKPKPSRRAQAKLANEEKELLGE